MGVTPLRYPLRFAEVEGAEPGRALTSMTEGVRQEDVTQPLDGVEVRSEALSEPSVAPSEGEQPFIFAGRVVSRCRRAATVEVASRCNSLSSWESPHVDSCIDKYINFCFVMNYFVRGSLSCPFLVFTQA